jgi:hypothetical protein
MLRLKQSDAVSKAELAVTTALQKLKLDIQTRCSG